MFAIKPHSPRLLSTQIIQLYTFDSNRLADSTVEPVVPDDRLRLQIVESLRGPVRPTLAGTRSLALRVPGESQVPARVRRDRGRPRGLQVHLRSEYRQRSRLVPGEVAPGEAQLQGQEHEDPEAAQAQGPQGPRGGSLGSDKAALQAALLKEYSAGMWYPVRTYQQLLYPHGLVP